MPRGSHHKLAGLLLQEGRDLILRVDGGGQWRLDAPRSARKLVGSRVVVAGVRDDFDVLGVTSIKAE